MYCISGHSEKTFHSHVTLKGTLELTPVRPSAQHNWPILDTLIINEAKNKEHFISPEDSSQIIFTANGQTVSPQTVSIKHIWNEYCRKAACINRSAPPLSLKNIQPTKPVSSSVLQHLVPAGHHCGLNGLLHTVRHLLEVFSSVFRLNTLDCVKGIQKHWNFFWKSSFILIAPEAKLARYTRGYDWKWIKSTLLENDACV